MSPNQIEADVLSRLPGLLAERDAETDKRKKKQLSSRIRAARILRAWARSRAGYVAISPPSSGVG